MRAASVVFLTLTMATPAAAQVCAPSEQINAVRILGTSLQGEPTDQVSPEVAGLADFYQTLPNGWIFALVRDDAGWIIRIYESEPIGDAQDLTALTPPFDSPVNPRQIYGWHFRNAENTGPNDGDVNAPQRLRAFVVSPSLAGTGGFKPPRTEPLTAPSASENDGIGWLSILDFGLADLGPGGLARMNYMKFDACVTWPRDDDEIEAAANRNSPDFLPEEVGSFGTCGLDLATRTLEASILPRTLGGDIDGDGAIDVVAQVVRTSDRDHGLALCRAGTWLDEIDLGVSTDSSDPVRGIVDQMEAWHWLTRPSVGTAAFQGHKLPDSDGDLLILERIEKEAVAFYWKDGGLKTRQLYRYVEP